MIGNIQSGWHFYHLLTATFVLLIALMLPNLRRHWPLWAWVSWRCFILAALTFLLLTIVGSPVEPRFAVSPAGLKLWEQFVEAGWWVVAAQAAASLARLFIVLENRPRETRIVSDLFVGALYIATILAIVNFAFHVPIRGLLATSGVIAIVLGLALQSTLSDVFSGIAVGLERPYEAGDLIWVEGGIEGKVAQVNWRSTHIVTIDHNIAVVPNSIIAKSRLVNRSAPTPLRADSISVSVDPSATSECCLAALTAAMRAALIPSAHPAPGIGCTGLQGDGMVYEISFYVDSSDQLTNARAELFTQVHRHLKHAGISLAVANLAVLPKLEIPMLDQLLERSELFGLLEAPQRRLLAEHFTAQLLNSGDTLMSEGMEPDAMYIIASGTAEITKVQSPGEPRVIYRISPGETLGAVALITGNPYSTSATALTPMKVYQLAKAKIAEAIKLQPELREALEALAARGQITLSRNASLAEDAQQTAPEMFLPKLRALLHLLAS